MTKNMTQGSPARHILFFALPLLAGMLFQQLYSFVDTMIVGRFLGVRALAGVGATGSVNFLIVGFCIGICSGFAIPVAQAFGARRESEMREYVAGGVWTALVLGTVLSVLTVINARRILVMMRTPADCIEEAHRYMQVIFAGIPCTMAYNLLSGWLRSLGDSKTPLVFLILSSVLNVVLDLAFILLLHLGVFGAALATIMSQGISAALCLLWIALRVPVLHITREEWKPKAERIRTLCACGVPMGLQYSITAIGSVILQTAINGLGSVALAAMTAGDKVNFFLFCPFDALGATMATYGAQNVGARRYDRLNAGLVSAVVMGLFYSVLAFGIVWFAGTPITRLFIAGEGGAQMLALAKKHMLVNVLCAPLLLLVNTVRFMIQGMGFSVFAMLAGVMEMFARTYVGISLVPRLGFVGGSLGGPVAWLFADAFLIPAYLRCRRQLMHHDGFGTAVPAEIQKA